MAYLRGSQTLRAVRVGAAACGAVGGVVLAQLVFVAATYKSPPDALGPRQGRIEPPLQSSFAHSALLDQGPRPRKSISLSPASTSGDCHWAGRPLQILFIGDSIVTGVGCDSGEGPTLARRFAQVVAERLDVAVHWHALGKTGADVATIRERIVRSEALRDLVAAKEGAVDTVVLLCGVNDFKRLPGGRTASSFGNELKALLDDIRSICGDDCCIILPALPMHLASLFPRPLHFLVTAAAEAWDAQKQRLSAKAALRAVGSTVLFVEKPTPSGGLSYYGGAKMLLSADGVHPNDAGYAQWADHLADEVVPHLRRMIVQGRAQQILAASAK